VRWRCEATYDLTSNPKPQTSNLTPDLAVTTQQLPVYRDEVIQSDFEAGMEDHEFFAGPGLESTDAGSKFPDVVVRVFVPNDHLFSERGNGLQFVVKSTGNWLVAHFLFMKTHSPCSQLYDEQAGLYTGIHNTMICLNRSKKYLSWELAGWGLPWELYSPKKGTQYRDLPLDPNDSTS
jgi:hypothetical protein